MTEITPPRLSCEVPAYVKKGRYILKTAYVDAQPGSVTALVGASGAGKTTVMHIMLGLRRCEGARVHWEGEHIERPRFAPIAARGLFFLSDFAWLHPTLTVEEHLRVAGMLARTDWRPVAAEYDVGRLLHVRTISLSGGEARLVGLLLALLVARKVVVADEPWRGLDPITRESISRMLRSLAVKGLAVLVADHDVNSILRVADRVFSIEQGRTRLVTDFRDTPISRWYHSWPADA
jgi:ABC-type multidrug transport system ATPase subunit